MPLTVEDARHGGKASAVARRNLRIEVVQLRAELAAIKAKQVLVPVEPSESYTATRLTRARERIDAVYDMLEAETDPQKIDRLASALARLNEIERQLANRPLPGSWKPERPAQTARRMPRVVAQPLQVQPNPPNSPENTG